MGENVIPITDPPVQSDEEAYASVGRQMRAEADQAAEGQSRLAASRVAGGRLSPERAASVLEIARARGVSPAEVAGNYDTYHAADEERMTYDALSGRPVLSEYTLDSEAHAAIVRRDLPTLAAMADGLKLGMLDLGTALLANKQGKAGLNPDEDSALSEAERLSAEPIQTATTLPRKVAAEIARATPTLALFGSAVASGAGIGMVLGGPGGAAIGGTAAALGTAFTIGWGPLYRRLKGLTQEDGVTPLLDEEQAKAWTTAGAGVGAVAQVGIGAPFFKALPGVSGALQKVGLDAAARAASTSVGAAAVRQLAGYGGHVLSGGLAMAGQSAVNAAAVEWAKQQNGAEPDWGAVTDAAAEGFKAGLLLAPLSLYGPVREFMADRGRILAARYEEAHLYALAYAAKNLAVIRTAPAEAEKVLASLAGPTRLQAVFVVPEELTPKELQTIASVVGPEAMAEAQATGGAIAVPIEKYLVHLADQHEALQLDVKLSPDGMTPREAEEWQKKLADISEPLNAGKLTEIAARGLGRTPTETEMRATVENLKALGFDIPEMPPVVTGGTEAPAPEPHPVAAAIASVPVADQPKVAELLAPKPVDQASPSKKAMGEIATARIESMRLGDIHPGRYEQDSKRAGDRLASQATEAAQKAVTGGQMAVLGGKEPLSGDQYTGRVAKTLQGYRPQESGKYTGEKITRAGERLVNSAESALEATRALEGQRDFARTMADASADVRKEAEQNRKFLLGFTKDDARAELGKAGADHLAQVDRLLAGFELGQGASRTEVARRQATMDWIAREQAANRDPIIPDSVMAKLDRFVHWKELTPVELRDLRSAVESIAHVAKLKNTLLEKQARVDRGRGMDQLVTALRDNTEEKPFRPRGTVVERLGRVLDSLNGLTYGLRAVERIVNTLDGGEINGPWHRYIWDPINDGTNRWHDITRKTTDALAKTIEEMPSEDRQRWRETRFSAAGQQWDLTAAIAVALNSGNDSNARKMLEGWQHDSVSRRGLQKWNEDTPQQFLRHLTRADWEFVQRVWDRLEGMWPESAALEKRLTGAEPPKVKPRPFTVRLEDGSTIDMPGGYYPVIYDPDFSRQGAAAEESSSVKLFDRDYYRTATPQGRLQERIEGFSRPVLLTLDNLPGKISEAAKDVAMREALISVHSALTDDTMRAALHTSELGRAGEKALLGWLRDTANDLVVPENGAGPWFTLQNKTRAGYTASLFAYNLGQTWQNLTAIIPATKAVGPRWMANAMTLYARERGAVTEWIKAQSGEIRNEDKGGQILSDAIREATQGKGLTTGLMRFGVNMFRATDLAVKYPAWLGDYMRSIALPEDGGRGLSHEEAVKHAEATVRLNVMANNTKDLPALLRNRIGRWMLPLYSYSLHRLNIMGDAIGAGQRLVKDHKYGTAAAVIGGVWGALAGEAVLSEIVKGNGPTDSNDDGSIDALDWTVWTAKVAATAPLTWLPFIGNSIRVAATGRDPLTAPEVSVFATVGRTARDAYTLAAAKMAGEEADDAAVQRLVIHLVESGGYLGGALSGGGLPVAQIRTTAGYLLDENSPKDTPLQVGLGVALGKKRPGKLLSLTE